MTSIRDSICQEIECSVEHATTFSLLIIIACSSCSRSNDGSRPEDSTTKEPPKRAVHVPNDQPKSTNLNTPTTPIGIPNDRFVDSLVGELGRASTPSTEWQSELISEKTTLHLKQLVKSVTQGNTLPYDWSSSPLVPKSSLSFEDHLMRVIRSATTTAPESNTGSKQLRQFILPFPGAESRYELKTIDVVHRAESDTAITRLLVSVLVEPQESDTNGHRLQRNSQWKCTWKISTPDQITLTSIESERFEQIEAKSPVQFNDVSNRVLTGADLRKQLNVGIDYWRSRIDWRFGLDIIGPHGIAIGDVNQDGFDDVYYCEAGGLPNRLLIRQTDGTVKDESSEAGVDFLEPTQSALFLDLDNDGDQDLVLACGRYVLLLANNGSGKFSLSSIQQLLWSSSSGR